MISIGILEGGKEFMKNKIMGILVCTLFLLSVMTGAVSTNIITKTDNEFNQTYEEVPTQQQTVNVWLKFFVHDECTKNISQMVADCNDIFDGGSGSRNGVGIIQFGTNGTVTTLPDSDFDNVSTSQGRTALLRKLKTQHNNCSNGINVVIVPNGHFGPNGYTYFNKGTGTNDKPYGGIILRDTCNQDQMNKTLAHELLHALGLSHEQVKWNNPETGETESKPIGSTIVNGSGPGNDRNIPAGSCGYPVPPHGYAYYDKDGDCDCEDDDEEQPSDANGNKIWDIDGNCQFGDANDTGSLLWGRADRTNTTISEGQKKEIFDNANTTPGYRLQDVGEEVPVPQKEKTKSKGLWDRLKDVGKKFLDILGGLINVYYDHGYTYFGLELDGMITEGFYPTYYYYIDIDNDFTTGDPLGFDYLVDLLVTPDYIASALSEWDPDYNMFIEIAPLDWNIVQGIEESEDDEDCNELETEGMVIQWNIPFDLLYIGETGSMRVMAISTDEESREVDITSEFIISKERANVPVLNLNPFNGNPGEIITCNGYDYTPNTDITIEFNCNPIATTITDNNGDFTTTIVVPPKSQGYTTVNAYDTNGKFHFRLFYVENLAPEKPDTPSGPQNGKKNTEYTYSSSTTDGNKDQLYYLFDWDDGTDSGWLGPYSSGSTASAKHAWTTKGDYEVKVKAMDINGEESVWSDPLPVSIPRTRNIYSQFLEFLQQHPNLFPMIRYILGLN